MTLFLENIHFNTLSRFSWFMSILKKHPFHFIFFISVVVHVYANSSAPPPPRAPRIHKGALLCNGGIIACCIISTLCILHKPTDIFSSKIYSHIAVSDCVLVLGSYNSGYKCILHEPTDKTIQNCILRLRGGAVGGGGGKGGKSPPKDFKIGENEKNMGYFHASKLLKLAFLSSLTRKYVLWKGFYHNFSTKKASASRGFAPDPHQGALPPGPPWFLRPSLRFTLALPLLRLYADAWYSGYLVLMYSSAHQLQSHANINISSAVDNHVVYQDFKNVH